MSSILSFQSDARVELGRAISAARAAREELATLRAARLKLSGKIQDAERVMAEQRAEIDREAASIVDSIKRGVEVAVSFVRAKSEPKTDTTVARAALARLDAAISEKQAELERLANQTTKAVDAVLQQEAASIVREYQSALGAARDAMTRLEALEIQLGRGRPGRLLGEMPGFALAGDEIERRTISAAPAEIGAAVDVWRRFASELSKNHQSKCPRFVDHDPNAPVAVVYHEMTKSEMRVSDRRNFPA